MTAMANVALVDQVVSVFKRACREHDWEVVEFLFQALEAIASREGGDDLEDFAYGELLEHFPGSGLH